MSRVFVSSRGAPRHVTKTFWRHVATCRGDILNKDSKVHKSGYWTWMIPLIINLYNAIRKHKLFHFHNEKLKVTTFTDNFHPLRLRCLCNHLNQHVSNFISQNTATVGSRRGLFYHYFYEAAGRSCFRINFVSEKSDSHASITLLEVVVWHFGGGGRRLLARLPRGIE